MKLRIACRCIRRSQDFLVRLHLPRRYDLIVLQCSIGSISTSRVSKSALAMISIYVKLVNTIIRIVSSIILGLAADQRNALNRRDPVRPYINSGPQVVIKYLKLHVSTHNRNTPTVYCVHFA